jgi:hypothetical protein
MHENPFAEVISRSCHFMASVLGNSIDNQLYSKLGNLVQGSFRLFIGDIEKKNLEHSWRLDVKPFRSRSCRIKGEMGWLIQEVQQEISAKNKTLEFEP